MKYIAYYSNKKDREVVLSAKNKIDSVIEILNKNNVPIEILSLCNSSSNGKLLSCEKEVCGDNLSIIYSKAYPVDNIIRKFWFHLTYASNIFKFLNSNIEKNETVMMYHTLGVTHTFGLDRVIKKLVKRKNIKLIYEVEEIYGDVLKNKRIVQREMELFKYASAYVFPTELLNEKVNLTNKPYSIIYGSYSIPEKFNHIFKDGKIHVVYAGTFDPRKGGCAAAAAAAAYLPNRYHIHILGFGSKEDVENIKSIISDVSKETECSISYDGLLKGDEYSQFLQSCQIGLSTQNPDADFNATSFPSKILSYMAHGLEVVSIRIPAIEKSNISQYMHYYDKQTPEEIAKAIMSVGNNFKDNSEAVSKLADEFSYEMMQVINKVSGGEE